MALLDQAQQSRVMAQAKKEEARYLAQLYGIPVTKKLPNGAFMELMEFRNGRPVYNLTDNANAALTTRATRLYPGGAAGLSLTGLGVTLAIWDGGAVRRTHQELTGRVSSGDGATSFADHATHVGGTMIASGVNAAAKGMSYQALLNSYDWNSDDAEMASAAAAGLVISNHSYGYITGWNFDGANWYWWGDTTVSQVEDVGFGYYDATSQTWDNVAYNAPYYLICKSAGNDRNQGPAAGTTHFVWDPVANNWVSSNATRNIDGNGGYDSIAWHGVAKNVMTVAAVNDVVNYTGPASVTMSSFSAWGPTDDGRIKPDISANGVSLFSSVASSDTAYANFSGTSMSTPNTSGSLGLLVQHYRNLNAGANMRSATLKALAIHTADEAGSFDGPDYAFGWGLLNVEAGAAVITANNAADPSIREDTISNGQTKTYSYYSDGSGPLRATICWTDPAHAPEPYALDAPDLMLVNDLDLRITAPDGTTVTMPWILDPANPSAAATKGDNFRDNVEQVLVPTTTAGMYTITVTHKGASLAPAGQQAFSMIVTGHVLPVANLTGLSLSAASVGGGGSVTGTVTLNNTAGGVVTLSSNNGSATVPASVTVPSGQSSATFTVSTTAVSSTTTATITATKGANSFNQDLQIKAVDLSGVSVSPISVAGGASSTGTVTVTGNIPAAGVTVTLSSDNAAATVPANVTVAQGQTTATFTINTNAVATTQNATITASFEGVDKTANLQVKAPVLATHGISPGTVTGGNNSTGTVSISSIAPTGGISISLSSNNSAATVPATVTVPAGQTSATYTVTTTTVTTTQNVTVTATFAGVTNTATLSVEPALTINTFALSPTSVLETNTSTGTVTLSKAAPSATLVTISETGGTSYLTLPASITIPAGSTTGTFTVTTKNIGAAARTATVQVVGAGATKTATLSINPIFVTAVTVSPDRVKGGNPSTGTVTISGPAGPGGVVVTLTDNSDYASCPATVTVPFGATSASFTITTLTVRRREVATIIANRNGQSSSALLTIEKNNTGGGAGSGG